MLLLLLGLLAVLPAQPATLDLAGAVVVTRPGQLPAAEAVASRVLVEEVARRSGITWKMASEWPGGDGPVIALTVAEGPSPWMAQAGGSQPAAKPESFAISVLAGAGQRTVVVVRGRDGRGVLFGVGRLLRSLELGQGKTRLGAGFGVSESPDVPIRGHQIGYRARANSWDAWTVAQFDQHFRELAIFGANCIENIPFEDNDPSPHFKLPREEMNQRIAGLCDQYDLDHWVWVPVQVALPNAPLEAAFLQRQEAFYKACKRLDAVFVPGGDPGDNHAKELLPFLEKMAATLAKHHPRAKVWLSLQGFKPLDVDHFYAYVDAKNPAWLGGVVMGPSSPPLEETRQRLTASYPIRWYPDITHTVRCQYPVPWWDPAFGATLGREPVCPRPRDMASIYRLGKSFTTGFITYSDGIHDDFNKALWSQLGWRPTLDIRAFAMDYARFFFRHDLAEPGGDALLALENNWRGSLAENSSVEGTLKLWQAIEKTHGPLGDNWRLEMHLMRAYYDAYTRQRLLRETRLQQQALGRLRSAGRLGAAEAIRLAQADLASATEQPVRPSWREQILRQGDSLFRSIGYQTTLKKHQASGSERACVLDFLDYPLNDRWWLEDQLARIAKLPADEAVQELVRLGRFDDPGPGGFYESMGHVGKSPRQAKLFEAADQIRWGDRFPSPTQRWMGEQRRPVRFAWHTYQDDLPEGLAFTGLDIRGGYTVRLFAQGDSPLLVDGQRARRVHQGVLQDQVTEQVFEVPDEAARDGKVVLSWEKLEEGHLNWRNRHYVTELWLSRTWARPGAK